MAWDKIVFNGEDADACNFTVIAGLSVFSKAEDMFLGFCKEHLLPTGDRTYQKLYAHYVFAGPSRNGGNNGKTFAFAPAFAKFLKAEKLGEVQESPEADNRKHHPGRYCQVFIWTPDQKACEAWYTDYRKKHARP